MKTKFTLNKQHNKWFWEASNSNKVTYQENHIIYGGKRKINKNKKRINKAIKKAEKQGTNKICLFLYN